MKYCFLFFCCFIGWIHFYGQNYPVAHRTINFIDANRLNRVVPTELYYPGTATGDNFPVVSDSAKFPVVCFAHGYLTPYSAYIWLADSLVKQGFIVAFPTTEGSAFPSHEQFGRDIAFVTKTILALNDSAGSFLLGRVAQQSAAGGHSMGGGCSFLAMNYLSSLKAIFNFCAAETTPSSKAAALLIQKPTLIFSGSADCIARDSNQLTMYNNIPYSCKTYINITGALHCQFANNDGPCVSGQIFSFCNSTSVPLNAVTGKTIALLIPFLNYYLKSACNSGVQFESVYTSSTGVSKQRSCIQDPFVCNETNNSAYIFNGSGNWSNASNWINNRMPPDSLKRGAEIIINPLINSSSFLDRTQYILVGARILVLNNKQLQIPGELKIQ